MTRLARCPVVDFVRPYPGQRASRVGVVAAAATIGRKDANVTTHTHTHARALSPGMEETAKETADVEETAKGDLQRRPGPDGKRGRRDAGAGARATWRRRRGGGLAVGVRALLIDFEYLLLRDDYTTFGQGFFRPVKLEKKI